jgi:hypothetical protein
MGFDRRKAKEALIKRTKDSNERKDGDTSLRYFNPDIEIPTWQSRVTKDDPHLIDIIPFLAGENFPQVDKRNPIKKGDYVYFLEVYIHQNIGPGKEWIVCPARNYGKPCPICEEIDRRSKEGQEYDDYAEIALKRRCVYNITCFDNPKEEAKGVQVWEVSYKYSEKPIQLAAKAPRGGGIVPFADPDVGKSISFEVANDTYNTHQGHKLVDRDYTIDDKVLDSTFTLDDLIVVKTYDEIAKIFTGEEEVEKQKAEEDVPDTVTDGTTGTRKRRGAQAASSNPCPAGEKYGVDIDKLEACKDCEAYNACADEYDRLEAVKKDEEEKKKKPEATGSGRLRRRS